jgi:phage-related protein
MATVHLSKRAQKDLKSLGNVEKSKALQAIQKLKGDIFAGHTLSGSLQGVRSLEFSAPGGAYRAAYVIFRDECFVFLVGGHENFYEEAERRYRSLRGLEITLEEME